MKFGYALLALFLLGGIFILMSASWAWKRASDAKSWPTSAGTLTACQIESATSGRHGGRVYIVNVTYAYSVGQHRFSGTRLAFGYRSSGTLAEAQSLCDELNSASTVEVHYAPFDPSLCTLQAGWNRWIRTDMLFALIWLTLTLLAIHFLRRGQPVADGTLEQV